MSHGFVTCGGCAFAGRDARMVMISTARSVALWVSMMAAITSAAAAQTATVEGRVVDEESGSGVSLATVELEGHGATLTTSDGSFRFDGVDPGGYPLRVVAYGYVAESRFLRIESDMTIELSLEPAPVPLDPLVARLGATDIEGRVRDPLNDFLIVGAEVLTNQGRADMTNAHGRFRLRGVLEGVPLRLTVREFGYLPLDTTIVPTADERYLFDLQIDSVVEAMVAVQVERLVERAAPRFAPLFRNINRDRLLRYAGSHTLMSVLEFEYWPNLKRVRAVVVDGRRTSFPGDPYGGLTHILPEEVQRVEFASAGRGGVVVIVYTRDFMRELIARQGN